MSKVMYSEQKARPSNSVLLKERFKHSSAFLVVLLHLVGFLGLAMPTTRPFFLVLTPFHLAGVAFLLFWHDTHQLKPMLAYLALASITAFGLEVLGVQYGRLFGAYTYGNGLGLSFFGVPILIGINWAMLAYCVTSMFIPIKLPFWQKIAFSALLLVGFDACLEPAAVGLGFWVWPNGYVPGQNYLGWWLTALPVCWLRFTFLPNQAGNLAAVVWWSQFFFFFVLSQFIFPSV